MQLITTINGMRAFSRQAREDARTIGLTPTMGSLHDGHLSLIRRSKSQCDATVVSIFVNPAQFGPGEDFGSYPRDLDKDIALLQATNVDAVFAPAASEIYPDGFSTSIDPGPLASVLEGAARPGHFRGVATIVVKLFNIVDPDLAFFGQKDLQQTVVIRQLLKDLNLRARLVVCPTVRAADGLAVSSRNAYLSPAERKAARAISRGLQRAKEMVWEGEEDPEQVIAGIKTVLGGEPTVRAESVDLVEAATLKPVNRVVAGCAVLVAARVGSARLIDNVFLGQPGADDEQLLEAASCPAGAPAASTIHPPGFEAGSLRRQIESCRDCAAITSVVLPPREFLAKYLKSDYPDLAAVRVLVIGRDAPWNGEHYIYRHPGIKDQFTERLYRLLGVKDFAEFKAQFAMTDALRCHGIVTPLPERALANCARHLPGEVRLFPNLRAVVILGEDAYLQFQKSVLRRESVAPMAELLAGKGWAAEDLVVDTFAQRRLRVIYCYHLAGGYRSSPPIAEMLP